MFGKRGKTAPTEPNQAVATPKSARVVASIGGGLALAAGAAISFQGLSGLGDLAGINPPWLLPIAIDVYAATSTILSLLLPIGHRARSAAEWNARLGLAMSMAGNAAFRALHLGSFTPEDGVLTFVGAWPSVIVERLLMLQGRVVGAGTVGQQPATGKQETDRQTAMPVSPSTDDKTGKTEESSTETANPLTVQPPADRQPEPVNDPSSETAKTPSTGKPEPRQTTTARQSADGQTSTDTWVLIGKPVYERLRAEHGKRPGETVFHNGLTDYLAELIEAGELVGENKDEKPELYAAKCSLSTAKRIRGEIEIRFPGILFGHALEDQAAHQQEGAA